MKPLVVLGPTGVGKTKWLLSRFNRETHAVVNIDSVQVYRYFDIGSAKVSYEERLQLPHFMVDERDPLEELTVETYVSLARDYVKKIQELGKRPIISGGTPYYLKHLLWGTPCSVAVSQEVRRDVAEWITLKGKQYAYKALQALDPLSASGFHANDIYRLSRSWEIYRQTGCLPSSFNEKESGLGQEFEIIGLMRSRSNLWDRVHKRVELMLSQGLEEEVLSLRRKGYETARAMKAIGYKEWIEAQEKNWTQEQVAQMIYIHTRQYIKRQLTFFRSFQGVRWIDLDL